VLLTTLDLGTVESLTLDGAAGYVDKLDTADALRGAFYVK
jgi:hypothetical protein